MRRRPFSRLAPAAILLALVGCADLPVEPNDDAQDAPMAAPGDALLSVAGQAGRVIPDRYLVTFRKGVTNPRVEARRMTRAHGGRLHYTYETALEGFAATFPEAALRGLMRNPNIAVIEPDRVVTIVETQTDATWGLDRVDQRDLPLSGTYTYTPTGAGVRAYIIDTGIRTAHGDFGGRASVGYDALGGSGQDCNGHGTHVAGTVAGTTYGVAKATAPVAIRVLNCSGSGTLSGVIAGVDWVSANHVKPAVANMSLGGGASSTLDNAVRNSIAAGVTYAIAAGNSSADACNASPARVATALTVGASSSSDARASFSNFGSCLDLFAPGVGITSAWHSSNTATNTISGTSMAAPHVAGVAALYLEGDPGASPDAVSHAITSAATSGRISGVGSGSPDLLLYSLLSGDGGGDPVPAPEPEPEPEPEPDPAPCTGCDLYSGTLSGTGDADYHPDGTYYYSGVSGTHSGWLSGPADADFDLYLYRWTIFGWWPVASSYSPTSEEQISYSGTSGYYTWRVDSYSGSGAYDFWLQRP